MTALTSSTAKGASYFTMDCGDDNEVEEQAADLADAHDIETWQEQRKVAL
ncbi:MAG TPA: hypothetical protein VFB02_18925 [Bradyrhizobium sp.]|nr:hypothetical protein [Bradyrhizobium sp.]